MILDFIIPFAAILLAEFGDKTQIAILSMSAKTKNHLQLFLGVLLAFILVDGLAIYFGEIIVTYIPLFWMKLISGTIFIAFGLIGIFASKEEENKNMLKNKRHENVAISSFTMIFFAEMGDKSQIASAVFAGNYNAWMVFFGVILALSILSIIAIFIGNKLMKKINKEKIERIANITFIVLGIIIFSSLI